ncbi:glycosyltransferase family 2 protein [Pseudarthrobacter quantipunctorum]|uniref:Glycosyltransferase n=1 Tax=Pseudarthrobacter quantipunctorum TaxID=3128980 RepID=A0ABZ2R9F7_9MICC
MNISVVIATVDRRDHLDRLLACLSSQTVRPDEVVVSAPTLSDLCEDIERYTGWVKTVVGKRGASAQRNAALDSLDPAAELIVFFDDDMTIRSDYIENCALAFVERPDIVGLTGELLGNGARTGVPVTFNEADAVLATSIQPVSPTRIPVGDLYGCNFAVRAGAARDLRFDERLPLYSWLEDLDFSRRLSQRGSLIRDDSCLGVHHGSASGGRSQNLRYGYSQITNPVYLWKKGTIDGKRAMSLSLRPLTANVVGAIWGHQSEWRRARLRGNLLSISDLLRRRVTPERVTGL